MHDSFLAAIRALAVRGRIIGGGAAGGTASASARDESDRRVRGGDTGDRRVTNVRRRTQRTELLPGTVSTAGALPDAAGTRRRIDGVSGADDGREPRAVRQTGRRGRANPVLLVQGPFGVGTISGDPTNACT